MDITLILIVAIMVLQCITIAKAIIKANRANVLPYCFSVYLSLIFLVLWEIVLVSKIYFIC